MLKNQWDREEANRSQLSCAGTRAAFGIEGGGTAATRPITPDASGFPVGSFASRPLLERPHGGDEDALARVV